MFHQFSQHMPSARPDSFSDMDDSDVEFDDGVGQRPSQGWSESIAAMVPQRRTRTITTPAQLSVLSQVFAETQFPTTQRREQIAEQIGLSPRKVQIWFQNSRQKAKNQAAAANRPRSSSDAAPPPPTQSGPHHPFQNNTAQYTSGTPYASPYASNPLPTARTPSRSQTQQVPQWAQTTPRSHTPGPLYSAQSPMARSSTSHGMRPPMPNSASQRPYGDVTLPPIQMPRTSSSRHGHSHSQSYSSQQAPPPMPADPRRRNMSISQAQAPHSLRSQTYDPNQGRGSPMPVDLPRPRYDPVRDAQNQRSQTPALRRR